MTTTMAHTEKQGGGWLLGETPTGRVFTPERCSDEHRLMAQTTREFVANEVLPALERMEQKDWACVRQLLHRCGELGLLGVDAPETYGGVELDTVAAVIVAESLAASASFGATFGAQCNLAIIPLLFFGSDPQCARYLPGLVSGETVGAYALSESSSGSDALSAKTRATRQADGSFVLNGEKMWITNGGFADLFIVFAKVDGEQFSAFIVERTAPGVSTGQEEHKLGLRGSSTTPVILQDAQVPADNLLGEIGLGHKVAFNVLNYGRFKLCASTSGGAKTALAESARYAAERKQFGQAIAEFGAIKHKLGEMSARAYAVESMLYRVAGAIEARIGEQAGPSGEAKLAAFEEFAIEASILKVAGSEMLDYLLDENIQVHGGNGFVEDYPAERHYRDARVNRIFEGTNEINRLLIPGMLARRALAGRLALIPAAKQLQEEILQPAPVDAPSDDPLAGAKRVSASLKKVVLLVLGVAMQTFGDSLRDQQEVLSFTADIVMDAFSAESVTLRASAAADTSRASLHADAAQVAVQAAATRSEAAAREALAAMSSGDALRTQLGALRRLLRGTPANTVAARRRLAEAAVSRAGYMFEG
ncbi:MAG: acyl-CoA dehydrogenase family protein [Vicinamibacterales bacterium]|jgi:alkylation response protein AidB-like acyl-CoA dehydrogenase|nr:acyl-CoA dehydrogenase [Acidobacteriota bacterium]MDP6372700.1 acyl-CoA dehydrogenase family protein [Vicinamibacterales bacterium]MDP6608697.1 acyl-CoA dehydrogenase family protein [Vicinamibacterales bacterium]HAK54075.1 acyl-CoA dehydrogenase [Acidobacteriota bacterium]|tara:strand:- start:1070 stop:2845 length:1776 start_codon:yes stop_codon:yes gene_type:complete